MRPAVIRLRKNLLSGDSQSPIRCFNYHAAKLSAIGKFEEKLDYELCYPAGQSFLHRKFGYRGVVLFPWMARVHDVDVRKQYSATSGTLSAARNSVDAESTESQKGVGDDEINDPNNSAETRSKKFTSPQSSIFHPHYQVLIDTRDCRFVSGRTQTEAVTFLDDPDKSKSIYSIKGLDYVAHEDILPYTSLEEAPIRHELYTTLFDYNPNGSNVTSKYVPSEEKLASWRNKHPWLKLSRVYKETTENIRVTVIPFYLGQSKIEGIPSHWWRYCVRLENFSDVDVQLRERQWTISSHTNRLQIIKGRGVVGVEPLLTKSEPVYQYSSQIYLQDKSGHMWGTFKMQREDGHMFECRIPIFHLESSLDSSSV